MPTLVLRCQHFCISVYRISTYEFIFKEQTYQVGKIHVHISSAFCHWQSNNPHSCSTAGQALTAFWRSCLYQMGCLGLPWSMHSAGQRPARRGMDIAWYRWCDSLLRLVPRLPRWVQSPAPICGNFPAWKNGWKAYRLDPLPLVQASPVKSHE